MSRATTRRSGTRVAALLSGLLAATVLAGCAGGAAEPEAFTGTRLDPPFEVSPTPLVDTGGLPFSLTEDTDKPLTLVFFGYTHCPDICGQVMSTLAGTMTRLSDEEKEEVDVVFVTTDPHRDTPQVVSGYVDQYDDAFIGLTGDLADVVDVGASMKVAIGYVDAQGDDIAPADLEDAHGYEVDHGTQVFAIDSDDDVVAFWRQDVSQSQLASDTRTLLEED